MKTIYPIKNSISYPILVDDETYEWLSLAKWSLYPRRGGEFYAAHKTFAKDGKRIHIKMHRLIMDFPNCDVDHINGNSLDNRIENLRLATHAQNQANRRNQRNNKTGLKGVSVIRKKCYVAQISGRYIGSFSSPDEAARAYDKAAVEKYGEFALTNEMMGLI